MMQFLMGRRQSLTGSLAVKVAAVLVTMLLTACLFGCGAEPEASQSQSSQNTSADATSNQVDGSSNPDGTATDTGVAEKDTAVATQVQPLPPLETTHLLPDDNPAAHIVEFTLSADVVDRVVHPSVPKLPMFLYNGQFPGPTLRARVGDTVIIHFKNNLPQSTTVHWHGLRVPDTMDGSPLMQTPIKPGGTFTYTFVLKDAGSFWYHPHMRTAEQVERGLYGMFIVEEAENIGFTRDRTLIIDDMLLNKDGFAPFDKWNHPTIMHGRGGNVLLLNGEPVIKPSEVAVKKGDVERWRVLNASNSRAMTIDIIGPAFLRIVGTDGGIIAAPYDIENKRIEIPVGTRYDIEVAYYEAGAVQLRLMSQDSSGGINPIVMLVAKVAKDPKVLDMKTPKLPIPTPIGPRKIDRTVDVVFDVVQDATSPAGAYWRINGNAKWVKPIFSFEEGQTVIMNIKNEGGPPHPFHLHGQFFEILKINGADAKLPGLKDTVHIIGQSTAQIRVYFDNPGMWLAHCHILEHAELGMIGEVYVKPKAKK